MKKIGLIGGASWVSTLDYYKFINEGINKELGGLNYAECIIYSLNFADIQNVGWVNSYDLLLKAALSLKRSGIDAIALGANTAHLFADEIEKNVGLPIIHIATATARAVSDRGLTKVGLLGTKFTMEMDFLKKKIREHGLEILIPEKQEVRDYLQHTIKEELGRGIITQATKQKYLSIIGDLEERGAEGVLLACTEIPMLLSQEDLSLPVFDTTKIHSEAIVEYMLS